MTLVELDVVALRHPLPEVGLVAGQQGVIVLELAPGVFEVEFFDDFGNTLFTLPLKTEEIVPA